MVTITKPEPADAENAEGKLSFSRAYSLALSPQIIYARSTLLQHLVSSRVYRQLEFLAVGSWWVYTHDTTSTGDAATGKLLRVPNGREDVFQDHQLDFKAKRALMKFLRFITEYEEQTEVWNDYRQQPFSQFLSEQFKIPATLQGPLLALALSQSNSSNTTTEYALPRIARHLRSIGIFGAGFGAVIPKWGGLAEISQVSCRACAVGGGVYVLGKGLTPDSNAETTSEGDVKLHLKYGEAVTAKWVVGGSTSSPDKDSCSRSVTIVASPLAPLFPPIAEEAPAPASAVVVFPSGSLSLDDSDDELPPVNIFIHSSDTGECPSGQSKSTSLLAILAVMMINLTNTYLHCLKHLKIISSDNLIQWHSFALVSISVCKIHMANIISGLLYASTSLSSEKGRVLLRRAVDALLASVEVSPTPGVLWSAQYRQNASSGSEILPANSKQVISFPPPSLDLAFDDTILDNVKAVWQKIVGEDGGEFLVFQDREQYDDEE
jgi:RAB protein geranylgeranyltransferase component A